MWMTIIMYVGAALITFFVRQYAEARQLLTILVEVIEKYDKYDSLGIIKTLKREVANNVVTNEADKQMLTNIIAKVEGVNGGGTSMKNKRINWLEIFKRLLPIIGLFRF